MAFIALSSINSVSADSSTIYVNGSNGNDSWDGFTWATAKLSIKNATGTVANGGTVNIANGVYTGVNNTNIAIDKNMAIKGQSQNGTIINGTNSAQIFEIQGGKNVTIFNLIFANGNNMFGGAIKNVGNLTVTNCTFTGNNGSYGAIYTYGNLTITGSYFKNNTAGLGGSIYNNGNLGISDSIFTDNTAQKGGAIENVGPKTTVNNCTFANNTATYDGGAIYNEMGYNLTITGSVFTGNNATGPTNYGYGGAIYSFGTCDIDNCTFTSNGASNKGGAVYHMGNNITIDDCTFANNSAVNNGGAIYSYQSTCTVNSSSFTSNAVTGGVGYGGAICKSLSGTFIANDCTFTGNTATYGGAIYNGNSGNNFTETILGCVFSLNTANYGGAICNDGNSTTGINLNITNSTFTGNSAANSDGGAIWCSASGNLTVDNCTFNSNSASHNGGVIFNRGYYATTENISNCLFNGNSAANGGAICNGAGPGSLVTSTVDNCTFIGNSASGNGGAIYYPGNLNAKGSTFSGNSAANGGAIYNCNLSTLTVHLCRIIGNTAQDIYNQSGSVNANYNWWGSNDDPSGRVSGLTISNWLVLRLTASPTQIPVTGNSTVTADLQHDNFGTYYNPASGHVPNGIPVIFSSTLGSVSHGSVIINNGSAAVIFTAGPNSGIAKVNATADGVNVGTLINVGTDIYVSTTGNDTTGDGSQSNPYQSISKGITMVSTGGNVNLSNGVYAGSNNTNVTINKNVKIVGQSTALTIINAQNSSRIFSINTGRTVTISNLTLTNGNTTNGGAIENRGTLNLNNCTFTGNTANYGAAIYNYVILAVNNSTFTGNTANYGGAIYNNAGTLTVNDSTFTSNNAQYSGGAIGNEYNGILTANGSSFDANAATNGGAIYNYGTSTVNFSRIVGNTAQDIYNLIGSVDADYNWWGSNANPSGRIYGATVSKWMILNITASPTRILITNNSTVTADLTHDNNGTYHDPASGHVPDRLPVAFNCTLGSLNPLISSITNGIINTIFTAGSNRGFAVVNATVDAQTVNIPITIIDYDAYVATTGNDTTGDGSQLNPYRSISTGISEVCPDGRVHIANGTYHGKLNRDIFIDKNISIIGESQSGVIIDAENLSRIFDVSENVIFALSNLTLTNGYTDRSGGVIRNRGGNLTITGCTFTGNTADENGGAIYTQDGAIIINNSTFTSNNAMYGGGAIYKHSGTCTIIDSTFTGNAADDEGGAIFNRENLDVISCNFSGNEAQTGGGIFNYIGTLAVTSSNFENNTYNAIYNIDTATVHFNRFVSNNGYEIDSDGTVNAENNWWGSNEGPSGRIHGNIDVYTWIVLKIIPNPAIINTYINSTITADLTWNTNDEQPEGYLPNVTSFYSFFEVIPIDIGSLNLVNVPVVNGTANTIFAPYTNGSATIYATVDYQTVETVVDIINTPVLNEDTLKLFDTIQEAIGDPDTLDGHRILVTPGTYTENLIVNKGLLIHSEGNVIIQALNANNPVLIITSTGSGSKIQGFTIKGSSNSEMYIDSSNGNTILNNTIDGDLGSSKSVWGICLVNSNGNNITNNTIIHCEEGINLYNSHNNTIANNTAKDSHWDNIALNLSNLNTITGNNITNADSGIRLIGGSNNNIISNNGLNGNIWTSVSLVNSQYNQINNNTLSSNQEGMYLYASNNNIITGNAANNNIWDGIAIHDSNNNTITGQTNVTDNRCGIRIIGTSTGNEILNNTVSGNDWSNISLETATNNKIHNNTLNNANVGIYLQGSSNNQIYNNTIQYNAWDGIDLLFGSNNNTLQNNTISGSYYGERIVNSNNNTSYRNNFLNNTVQAYDDSTNQWDNGSTGNYWSDWPSTSPRSIDGGSSVDNHPSTNPF